MDLTLDLLRGRFKHSVFCGAVILVALSTTAPFNTAWAQGPIGMSDADKSATIRALQAGEQDKWSYGESIIANTRDPLAAKIYHWMYYTEAKGPFDFTKISTFANQIPDWPQQGTLALAVEKSIDGNTPDTGIIKWFGQHSPITTDGMEQYLGALRRRGKLEEIGKALNIWWGDATLTPDQQDDILRSYGKLISSDAHKRRFNTTLYKGQTSNGRAIARVLGHGYPQLAEARILLSAGGSGVDSYVARVPEHLRNDPGLQLERLRWRRKKDMDFQAMEILHNAPAPNLIANPEDWWKERNILTRRLIERKQYESAYLLVTKHGLTEGEPYAQAEFLAGWMALRFLKKPWDAFLHFEALYKNSNMPITKARAAYWAGLACDDLKHQEIADQWFETGAKYQATFYGQMSLGRLGRNPVAIPNNPPIPIESRIAFESNEKIQAANLLFRAGAKSDAGAFLRDYADEAQTSDQFFLAAKLSDEWQRPNDSVAVAKKAQVKGVTMINYAFPTMLARMRNVKAEWALVHGIIRQESSFDPAAVSSAGAMGLMQLMPTTARETAAKAGVSHQTDWLVTRPDHNILLGSFYINKLLSRFDNSYPLAIAAYNAGPGRVDQWLKANGDPRKGEIGMIDWIELIPVPETRNYVQRVLEGVYIYRNKFKDLQSVTLPIHVAYDKRDAVSLSR